MAKTYKWGIIGPGKIAHKFATSIQNVPGSEVYAVASRDLERAQQFAANFGAKICYTDYAALALDEAVDVVYIATPHPFHHAAAIHCLENNKPLVCEKPLSVNYESVQTIISAARTHNTFLMEGMWTRFFPAIQKTVQLINDGKIGECRHVQVDFGFAAPFDTTSRLFDMKLGGGSLLDIGVYTLFLALLLLGEPDDIQSKVHLSVTGADDMMQCQLYYKQGQMAGIFTSIITSTPLKAVISGSEGNITISTPWYKPNEVVLTNDGKTETFSFPYEGPGFEYEIRHVMECLDKGLTESNLLPLDFSLLLGKTIDTICRQNGLRYELPAYEKVL